MAAYSPKIDTASASSSQQKKSEDHANCMSAVAATSSAIDPAVQDIKLLKELFPAPNPVPKMVKICKWPIDPKDPIKEIIPLSEFLKRINRVGWTETVLIDKVKDISVIDVLSICMQKELFEFDPDTFGFVEIKKGNWGTVNLKRIRKDKNFIHAGVEEGFVSLYDNMPNTGSHRLMFSSSESTSNEKPYMVNAKYFGNALSLFQDAPTENRLKKYQFLDPKLEGTVLTPQFKAVLYGLGSIRVLTFVSLFDIAPLTLLTITYDGLDMKLWAASDTTPDLYDK